MRLSRFCRTMIIMGVILALPNLTVGARTEPLTALERAKELWELAVIAKGGRERLARVTNFAWTSGPSEVWFIALPDRVFSWFDTTPGYFGLVAKVFNFASGFGFTNSGKQQHTYRDFRPELNAESLREQYIVWPQMIYFLETCCFRPSVVGFVKATVGDQAVDRIDVISGVGSHNTRYAVFLDEKTHLPVRVAACVSERSPDVFRASLRLRNYRQIAGIKVPTQTCLDDSPKWNNVLVEINTEYDPKVFDRIPEVTKGPFQWRRDRSVNVTASANISSELGQAQIEELIHNLGSTNREVRSDARRDLIDAGKQAVPALIEALKSSNSSVRYGAAAALVEIGDGGPAINQALRAVLLDPQADPDDAQDSAFGLLRNDEGIAILTDLLEHPDVRVRRRVIFAFDQLTERSEIPQQVSKALPALRRLRGDHDEVVRGMAKEVLSQIGDRLKR